MATYTVDQVLQGSSQVAVGDDVYCKPATPSFVSSPWLDDTITANPVVGTAIYTVAKAFLDTTISYIVYRNTFSATFTATFGSDLINSSAIASADLSTVCYFKGSDLPSGLTEGQAYYVINIVDGVSFQVEAVSGSGTPVALADNGSGSLSFTLASRRSISDLDADVGAIQADQSALIAEGELSTITAIKAKTDLIGTGLATVSAPVNSDGTLELIVMGDDYQTANSRAFIWTVNDPGNIATPGSAVCTFAGKRVNGTDTWSVTGTVADVGSSNLTLTFELADTDTAALTSGRYYWSVELVDDSGNEITVARNRIGGWVDLVAKQT